jgi:ABC-type Zn uptake system ZnuABC Zn-binding protein ZnuA
LLRAEANPERESEEVHENEDYAGDDPHTWTDPNNVMIWVRNVEAALSLLDPTHAPAYQANAEAYQSDLEELDAWIRQQVAEVPEADRQIVTDHRTLNYFVGRYGLVQVGAIIPGYSTLSEPSARELAAMEEAIQELGVKAIFVGKTVNPALAETVAEDTGTRLIFIYTGSLSAKGGDADTYIAYMRYNVDAIVSALR